MFRRGEGEAEAQPVVPMTETLPQESRDPLASGGDVTVVGRAARLEGNLVSAGSLQVDGQVKGSITAEGDVILSGQSQVEADVKAQNVLVAGVFTGNIVARGRAELARGGRVHGNVTSKSLVVADGAVFVGRSIMGGKDEAPAPKASPREGAASEGGGPAAPPSDNGRAGDELDLPVEAPDLSPGT